jgi:type 1 glutamine amidotransferase
MTRKPFALLALALLSMAPMMFAQAPLDWGPGIKVLIVSGGGWHEFDRWFGKADTASLNAAGITSVHYTESSNVAAMELPKADVMIMSANVPGFDTPAFRKAVFDHVAAGKGLVFLHSGVWHNFPWPEYERELIGGPARSHEGKAPFQEQVVGEHPVTEGLPKTFTVVDELYHTAADPKGPGIDVLVQAVRGQTKYASVWVVHHPTARIVCIALGHDGESHNQAEFKKLLRNSVAWAAGR